jgi:hypothetical protein
MAWRSMREDMSQFMQQGAELLALGEAAPNQDVAPVRGAMNEVRTFAPPDRCAQRGGKGLQRVEIVLWNPRCVHDRPPAKSPSPSIRRTLGHHEARHRAFRSAIRKAFPVSNLL